MTKLYKSRAALLAASLAAVALTATPASARNGRHHNRGIDGGDVLAGVLIFGTIAAVASAASNSNRDRRPRDYRYPEARYPDSRYPDSRYPSDTDYRDWRTERDRDTGYAGQSARAPYGGSDWRGGGAIDGAVSACTSEIEGGDRRIDSVEGVNRAADGWRVEGRLQDGRVFSCTAGPDGRVRSATVDGRALT